MENPFLIPGFAQDSHPELENPLEMSLIQDGTFQRGSALGAPSEWEFHEFPPSLLGLGALTLHLRHPNTKPLEFRDPSSPDRCWGKFLAAHSNQRLSWDQSASHQTILL